METIKHSEGFLTDCFVGFVICLKKNKPPDLRRLVSSDCVPQRERDRAKLLLQLPHAGLRS